MPVFVEPLSPERIPGIRDVLEADGALAEDAKFRSHWLAFLEDPFKANSEVLIARSGGQVQGFATATRPPGNRDGSPACFYWVAGNKRRQGIGRALKEGMDTRLAARGFPQQMVSAKEDWDDVIPFLEATGFTKTGANAVMADVGDPYSYRPVDGISCDVYTGGDPKLNADIADLFNRAFASDPSVAPTTGDLVQSRIEDEDMWTMVATEDATGKVVGLMECTRTGFLFSIAVARSHWGTGLADYLGGRVLDHCRETGQTGLWSLVRPTNRASMAFHERMGWQRVSTSILYASPTGAAPT